MIEEQVPVLGGGGNKLDALGLSHRLTETKSFPSWFDDGWVFSEHLNILIHLITVCWAPAMYQALFGVFFWVVFETFIYFSVLNK